MWYHICKAKIALFYLFLDSQIRRSPIFHFVLGHLLRKYDFFEVGLWLPFSKVLNNHTQDKEIYLSFLLFLKMIDTSWLSANPCQLFPPSGHCYIWGSSSVRTFDGLAYNYPLLCHHCLLVLPSFTVDFISNYSCSNGVCKSAVNIM